MESQKAKKLIRVISAIWFLLGLALAGGTYLKLVPLEIFKVTFAVCFIVYAILVTMLTRFMYGS